MTDITKCLHSDDLRRAATDLRCPLCMEAEIEQLRAVQFRSEKAEIAELRAANATMYIEIERLRAALLTCPCPGGGWNGMSKEIEATVASCLKADVCGCSYGRALADKTEKQRSYVE